ncbi:NurA domain-containing protein [Tumebacillus sp. BK434]|uniref:DNA double-strand break repair nuclease NurA n=1 Tax=Tumebacillus sp. BK434 TaxID=2512169 RepID=UPI001050D02C|nr:DNA double-strand break repair nuclease NurA [Tumebacillus sp. BK434]TCP53702.1 NurA domain-containing protein [Tumebacillus sp. BK434]
MSGLFTLAKELQGLNGSLHEKRKERADRTAIRAALETNVGEFVRAKRLSDEQIGELFAGRPLVGVDGSVNQFGSNYPYAIHLFKSLAKSTLPGRDGTRKVEKVQMFSPLSTADHAAVRQFVAERREELRVEPQEDRNAERDIAEQQAYQILVDQKMVELELQAAIDALKNFRPYLMLMDGGFSRLKGKGGELWEQFEEQVTHSDTIVVGVIEEVGSYRLKSRLDDVDEKLLRGFIRGHDREVLFNMLETGEWLKTSLERPIKNEFYTVFNRLSDQPQAGACDFLREQAHRVDEVIDFLYTITPGKSRGIPLWLDVVDAEARLTKKQVEMIVKSNVDQEIIESFLRPQRERRDF